MRFATPFAVIACLAGALALGAVAHAQSRDNLRKLSEAYKLVENGKTAEAIQQLDAVLEGAPEDTDAASKAMLLRGQAYAKAGRHAQALSDFNAALWLQGLSSNQRKEAVEGRKSAMAKLGLSDAEPAAVETADAAKSTPEPSRATAPPARARRQSQRAAPESWKTEVQAAERKQDSGGIGSFFSGLFGGNSDEPKDQTASVSPSSAPSPASGWATSTAVVERTSPAAAADGGRFRVQIASVTSREGAESEARRLSRVLGDAMAGETPSIVRTDTEAGNTYYRILVGPKPSRDTAEEMCQMFKSRGVDCLVLSSR